MPGETVVDRLYQDFQEVIAGIGSAEVSLQTTARVNFSKSLLLAAASYFEEQVKSQILDFVSGHSSGNELVMEFIQKTVIERQYHTLFDWKATNANAFFALFGSGFREYMKQHVDNDSEYRDAIRAFLEIGRERNPLVHENYAQFPLEKTVEEIYARYRDALIFVDSIGLHLERYSGSIQPANEG